ncbi:MAG: hypothetical protein HY908_14785, partial [Myxococcales bacterium]|nr:hypothetical protein [Myxococcales bacterium]
MLGGRRWLWAAGVLVAGLALAPAARAQDAGAAGAPGSAPADSRAADAGPEPGDAGASLTDAGAEAPSDAGAPAALATPSDAHPDAGPAAAPAGGEGGGAHASAAEGPRGDGAHAPAARGRGESSWVAVKTILGLLALLALAYVGAHPKVRKLERTLAVSLVIVAGFPFVALGLVASSPGVGILTPETVRLLEPLVRFGLGWIGFIVGFRLDVRLLGMPREVAAVVAVRTGISLAAIVGAAALLLFSLGGFNFSSFADPVFLRDALILGAAGVVTGQSAPYLVGQAGGDRAAQTRVRAIMRAEELAAIVGLVFLSAYFRPEAGATWQLPRTAWLLLSIGLGAVSGLLVYAIMLVKTSSPAEYVVLTVGAVGFAAGIAGKLELSAVVVCFVAGVLVQNFPGPYKERLANTLRTLERPIYLSFLLLVGALWQPREWQGWVLMPVFVAARLLGKLVGTGLGRARKLGLGAVERRVLVVSPMGALAIAIVVSAVMQYQDGAIHAIVTAVIGGAMLSEVVVQIAMRRRQERLGAGATEEELAAATTMLAPESFTQGLALSEGPLGGLAVGSDPGLAAAPAAATAAPEATPAPAARPAAA